jgi:Chaperone of endosialidase
MTTLHLRNSIDRSSSRRGVLLIPFAIALACFALLPTARADDDDQGNGNTADGNSALNSNTTGRDNTANGFNALFNNTTGGSNTANGVEALYSNINGSNNTASGDGALFKNTHGSDNTADGFEALLSNTTGSNNTANGYQALYNNLTGHNNTANGLNALERNISGGDNTADGTGALYFNTTGSDNTANGFQALDNNTTGSDNTANGFQALFHNTTGRSNIALGHNAGIHLTTSSNNIDIGNEGIAGESDRIRIGMEGTQMATFIAGIANATVTGSAVYINTTTGRLGLLSSSERFKDAIKPMDKASEAILALKPVTFRYKHELDPEGIPQFGLVAEEVAKVNPDLVVRDAEGKVFTVRYDAVNAMLLNEFLKEHRTVQELKSTAAKQEATIAKQQKQIEALTTGLQKVSDQLEPSKAASRIVVSN